MSADDFSDLDNELLGLGGDDDGSEASDAHHSHSPKKQQDQQAALSGDESEGAVSDSTLGSQSRKRKPITVVTSPSPPRRTVDDDDDDEGVGKGRKRPSPGDDESSPPKKRAKAAVGGARKGKKRRSTSDDEDDDDVFSSPSSSRVASEPISSDDDMADADASPAALYPVKGIYKSTAEMATVERMKEVDREKFIAERQDEVERFQEDLMVKARARRLKQESAKKSKKKHKKDSDDEDYEDSRHAGARRSTRGESSAKRSADSKKNASLSELMKKRDEKNARKAGGVDAERSKKKRRDESASEGEESSDGYEEPVFTSQPSVSAKKGNEEASFADIKLLLVGRGAITKYWAYPGFEKATTGCFVRVAIGNHPDTGKAVYRLCQINGWQDSKSIYEVSSGDRTIKFRRNAIISTGSAEKPSRVDVFSDGTPTEDEWRWYTSSMESAHLKRPTVAFVEEKRKQTKLVTEHQLTNQDIEDLRRKKISYYPDDPILPHLDIPGLKRRRQQLVDAGDEAEILRIDRELEWRAPPKSITATLNTKTQLDILGQINKRNREINRQDIRKAQLVEKKKNEIAAKMAAENGDSSFMDPFARVKTHAKIYHNEKPKEKEKETDMDDLFGGEEGGEKEKNGSGGPGLGKTDSKVPQVKVGKPKGIDAVIASMDLQFDIDFDA